MPAAALGPRHAAGDRAGRCDPAAGSAPGVVRPGRLEGGRMSRPRILIACVGNIFLGDDAFGVEVARRLSGRPLPEGVRVVDLGIRGLDLAYALLDAYEAVILVDAAPRGNPPGTLVTLDVDPAEVL